MNTTSALNTTDDYDGPRCGSSTYFVPSLISVGIFIVATGFVVMASIAFARGYFQSKATNPTREAPISLPYFLACLTFSGFTLISSTSLLLTLVYCIEGNGENLVFATGVHVIFYMFGGTLLLVLFIFRLNKVFQGTSHAFSTCTFIFLYSMMAILFGLGVASVIFFLARKNEVCF